MRWGLLSPTRYNINSMYNEVATLVHLIESSETVTRAQAVRLMVPLEVPRLLERRPYLTVARERRLNQVNFWGGEALHNIKVAGDFVLISAMSRLSVVRLCRPDE